MTWRAMQFDAWLHANTSISKSGINLFTDLPTTTIGSGEFLTAAFGGTPEPANRISEGCRTSSSRLNEPFSILLIVKRWGECRVKFRLLHDLHPQQNLTNSRFHLSTHGSIHPSFFSSLFMPADTRALPRTSTTYSKDFSDFPFCLHI